MRSTLALKKDLSIKFYYWKAFVGTAEQLKMVINDIEICVFGPRCIRTIESIFNYHFPEEMEVDLVASAFKVEKSKLYINEQFVTDFDYTRMWLINEAFAPITSYSIHVNHDKLKWTYSWSLDWHVQNLSSRVEDIENIKPKDLESLLQTLKLKYASQVTRNCYFAFEIIEYRGKEFNRAYKSDSVGCEADNFDEKIRNAIFKK